MVARESGDFSPPDAWQGEGRGDHPPAPWPRSLHKGHARAGRDARRTRGHRRPCHAPCYAPWGRSRARRAWGRPHHPRLRRRKPGAVLIGAVGETGRGRPQARARPKGEGTGGEQSPMPWHLPTRVEPAPARPHSLRFARPDHGTTGGQFPGLHPGPWRWRGRAPQSPCRPQPP
jgi:hypothetical protein